MIIINENWYNSTSSLKGVQSRKKNWDSSVDWRCKIRADRVRRTERIGRWIGEGQEIEQVLWNTFTKGAAMKQKISHFRHKKLSSTWRKPIPIQNGTKTKECWDWTSRISIGLQGDIMEVNYICFKESPVSSWSLWCDIQGVQKCPKIFRKCFAQSHLEQFRRDEWDRWLTSFVPIQKKKLKFRTNFLFNVEERSSEQY